jgi:hypothetical protein
MLKLRNLQDNLRNKGFSGFPGRIVAAVQKQKGWVRIEAECVYREIA